MQCLKCGSENSASVKFCHRCGNNLEAQRKEVLAEARRKQIKLWRGRLWGNRQRKGLTLLSGLLIGTILVGYWYYQQRPGRVFKDCADCPEMVVIPAGTFMMGSPASEEGRDDREGPQHPVNIPKQFAAGKFEVTFDEWDTCVRESGCSREADDYGEWGRGRRPVVDVSWEDAKQYTKWLSAKTGKYYRLLSEAEWEYAARAGTNTKFSTGANINPSQANYDASESFAGSVTGIPKRQTVPVGSYPPNAFGLHDVHGNVVEWTEDCWNANYNGAPTDSSARTTGDCGSRMLRGGEFGEGARYLRSAARSGLPVAARNSSHGFRVARTL